MKKLLFLITFILLLTGCTDYKELTDLAIISSVGIDYKDNNYNLIIQVLDSKEEKKNPTVILYKSSGKTINEAFRNILLECPKKLYSGHIQTFIVKDNLLKNGSSNFIDFILRNSEIEKDFNILLTEDDIDKIMDIIPPLETIPAKDVSNTIKLSSIYEGRINNVHFDDFLSNLYSVGIEPTLPILTIKNEKEKRLILKDELALFKDDKYITNLDSESSLGLNIIKNNAKSSLITFKCDKDNYASVEILKLKSKIEFDKNSNTLNLDVDITSTLSELNCNMDISKKEVIDELELMFKNKLHDILNKTINKEKKLNIDYIGIQNYIYKNNINYYKNSNINDIIKNLNSNIDINITFTQKSSIRKGDEKY